MKSQLVKSSLTAALIAVASLVPFAQSANAATFKFQSGPLTNLDPAGATINGGFTAFPTKAGMYIQQCTEPVAGARPATCSDTIQLWVTPAGGPGTTSPTGQIAIKVASTIIGKGTTVDCTKTTCGLFFRFDHTAPMDTSEDTFMPISFRAGAAAVVLPADEVIVTFNGKTLTRNVPLNLAYRAPAKVTATAKSGLPVTLSSLTPDCSYSNGVFTALKGAGQCALGHSTEGSATFAASRANYPFILTPGVQAVERMTKVVKVGKIKAMPAETNFGESIKYTSASKNCVVEANMLSAKKSGICRITATAAAKDGLWAALSQQFAVRVTR
jgi:hypothetical protein